jgi:hypothetical protein
MVHVRHEELEGLVDEGDISGVLRIASLDDVAEAWCRYTAREHADDEDDYPDWWAVEFFMMRSLVDARKVHREALLKLLEHAPDDHVIGCIGAGPLEDFVSDDADDLAWIERHAVSNPRLREALAGMWVATLVSEDTLRWLDHAAGKQLPRPR